MSRGCASESFRGEAASIGTVCFTAVGTLCAGDLATVALTPAGSLGTKLGFLAGSGGAAFEGVDRCSASEAVLTGLVGEVGWLDVAPGI